MLDTYLFLPCKLLWFKKGKELLGLKGKLINKCVYQNKETQVEITSQMILTRVNAINKKTTIFSIVLQIMQFNVIFFPDVK